MEGAKLNIPNFITALRFLLVPVFGYFLINENYKVAVAIFLLAGLTDILDGYIARKYSMITSFGKLADPVADKLIQVTAVFILTLQGIIPLPILVIVLSKEALMIIGSFILYHKDKIVVQASWFGKVATAIFYFSILAAIFLDQYNVQNKGVYISFALGIAIVSMLYAFIRYTLGYMNIRKGFKKRV